MSARKEFSRSGKQHERDEEGIGSGPSASLLAITLWRGMLAVCVLLGLLAASLFEENDEGAAMWP